MYTKSKRVVNVCTPLNILLFLSWTYLFLIFVSMNSSSISIYAHINPIIPSTAAIESLIFNDFLNPSY